MNEGLGRGGLVGEEVGAAVRAGLGIVDEERDLVLGVLMVPPLRDA